MKRAVMVGLMMGLSALVAPVNDVSAAEVPFDFCQDCIIHATHEVTG